MRNDVCNIKCAPLERILAGIDIYVYVTEIETGKIIYINKRTRDLFGLDETCDGKICWEVIQEGQTSRCPFCPVPILKQKNGEAIVWEHRNTINGRYYKNTDSFIEWTDGKLVHLQHAADITTEKIIKQRLMDAKWEADAANRVKSDFLSRISHEIRTPINAITGMSKIACSTNDPVKIKECLARIDSSSGKLINLINDVLDMSEFEAHKIELEHKPFDFEKILVGIYNVISVAAIESGLYFHMHMDKNMPRFYIGDENRISKIITHIVSNAVKFTPKGGSVSIEAREKGSADAQSDIEVRVTDTGIGIREEDFPKLFAPFEQVDGGDSRKYEGSGLGLAISKNLADIMKGDIFVESKVGEGSVFTFSVTLDRDLGVKQIPPAIFGKAQMQNQFAQGQIKPEGEFHIQKNLKTNRESGIVEFKDIIDVDDALARVRGNKKIYKTLLQSFLNNSGMDKLEEEFGAGNASAAAKTAHGIKGASANLSMIALSNSITLLESHLLENKLNEDAFAKCKQDFEKTKEIIGKLLESL